MLQNMALIESLPHIVQQQRNHFRAPTQPVACGVMAPLTLITVCESIKGIRLYTEYGAAESLVFEACFYPYPICT